MAKTQFIFAKNFLNTEGIKYYEFIENNEFYRNKNNNGGSLNLDESKFERFTYCLGRIPHTIENFVRNANKFNLSNTHEQEISRGKSYAIDDAFKLSRAGNNINNFFDYLKNKGIKNTKRQKLILALLLQPREGAIGVASQLGKVLMNFFLIEGFKKENFFLSLGDNDLNSFPVFDISDLKNDGSVEIMLQLPIVAKNMDNTATAKIVGKAELNLTITCDFKVIFSNLLLEIDNAYINSDVIIRPNSSDFSNPFKRLTVNQKEAPANFSIPKPRLKYSNNKILAFFQKKGLFNFFNFLWDKLKRSKASETAIPIVNEAQDITTYEISPHSIVELREEYQLPKNVKNQKEQSRICDNSPSPTLISHASSFYTDNDKGKQKIVEVEQEVKKINLQDVYDNKLSLY